MHDGCIKALSSSFLFFFVFFFLSVLVSKSNNHPKLSEPHLSPSLKPLEPEPRRELGTHRTAPSPLCRHMREERNLYIGLKTDVLAVGETENDLCIDHSCAAVSVGRLYCYANGLCDYRRACMAIWMGSFIATSLRNSSTGALLFFMPAFGCDNRPVSGEPGFWSELGA